MFRIPAIALLLFITAAVGHAQPEKNPLVGKVRDKVYYSATGAFNITIPVLQELGGTISDGENIVSFQDSYNVHVTIGCFPQDATQRWELSTRGLKDYLTAFFHSFVRPDFEQTYRGTKVESIVFDDKWLDGALLTFMLVPGGSMFADRVQNVSPDSITLVAKRGNLMFVKNGFIYVISVELAERVLEGTAYHLKPAEEDAILRRRFEQIIDAMTFYRQPTPPPPPAPAPTAP